MSSGVSMGSSAVRWLARHPLWYHSGASGPGMLDRYRILAQGPHVLAFHSLQNNNCAESSMWMLLGCLPLESVQMYLQVACGRRRGFSSDSDKTRRLSFLAASIWAVGTVVGITMIFHQNLLPRVWASALQRLHTTFGSSSRAHSALTLVQVRSSLSELSLYVLII